MKTNIPMLILISRSVSRQISPSLTVRVCIETEMVRNGKMYSTQIRHSNKMSCVWNFPYEIRKVETAKVRKQNLKDLLLKYGGVNLESGIICRNCFNKLDSLDRKTQEFYESCQKYALSSSSRCKRMASSPAVEKRPLKRSLNTDDSTGKYKACLFPTNVGPSTIEPQDNDSSSKGRLKLDFDKGILN